MCVVKFLSFSTKSVIPNVKLKLKLLRQGEGLNTGSGASQNGRTVGHNCVADGHQCCLVDVDYTHSTCGEEKMINVLDVHSTHTLHKELPNNTYTHTYRGNNYTPPKTQTGRHISNCTYITNKKPQHNTRTGNSFLPQSTQAAGKDCTHINKDPSHTHTGNNNIQNNTQTNCSNTTRIQHKNTQRNQQHTVKVTDSSYLFL